MEDLELTMSLFMFAHDELEPPLAAIVHPDLRRSVADKVNKAILAKHNQRRDAQIRKLVKMRAWAECKAREAKKDLPAFIDLGLHASGHSGAGYSGHEHETMMT